MTQRDDGLTVAEIETYRFGKLTPPDTRQKICDAARAYVEQRGEENPGAICRADEGGAEGQGETGGRTAGATPATGATPTPETLVEEVDDIINQLNLSVDFLEGDDDRFKPGCATRLAMARDDRRAIEALERLASLLAEREREIERRLDVSGLDEEQVDGIRKHIRGLTEEKATYDAPRHGWMCFHCGETFKTEASASLHFGTVDDDFPKCAEGARAAFKMLTNRAAEQAIKHADEMVAARQKISELRKALEAMKVHDETASPTQRLKDEERNARIDAILAEQLERPRIGPASSTKEDLPGGQEAPHHPQPPRARGRP